MTYILNKENRVLCVSSCPGISNHVMERNNAWFHVLKLMDATSSYWLFFLDISRFTHGVEITTRNRRLLNVVQAAAHLLTHCGLVMPQASGGHWPSSSLVQAMASRLIGAKSSPEPMLIYCQLRWNLYKIQGFAFTQIQLKMSYVECRLIWSNLKLLTHWGWVTHICVSKRSHHWLS